MILRSLLFVWVVIVAQPAFALDPKPIADDVVTQWQDWMKKHRISQGAIIVAHNGVVLAESGIKRTVDDPAKIASLSKAITAVCALKAADGAGLNAQTSMSTAIPEALRAHGPKDGRFPDITLGQLITHTSGIASDYHRAQLPKLRTLGKENKLWQFSKVVKETLTQPPGQAPYRYSNANYLILGLAIEEMSGEGYEDYCKREVLEASGVTTAQLNKKWKVMSSWGGWEISARDYLTFAQQSFTGENDPARPAGFSVQPADIGRGRAYSAGIIFRRTNVGTTSWHQGSWKGVRGRPNDPFGAYVALYDNGFSVVTNYAHDAWEANIRNELDTLLYTSTHP